MPRRVWLCRQALNLTDRKQNPALWAALQGELGISLCQNPQDDCADNFEQAIHHHLQVFQVQTRAAFPLDWARTQHNLATTYAGRIRGERANNLERAIHHYRQALEIRTRIALPEQWATTQNNLANAYRDRIRGERANNLERAICQYQQVLEVCTRTTLPIDWARTQNNLANAYSDRIHGERADNLERAIHHYRQALEIRARPAFSADWAITQNDLANAYLVRIHGKRADNLEQAIHHFEQTLEIYIRTGFPERWAAIQNNLASVYGERIRGERANNLEQAVHHFEQAIEVRTRANLPLDWAMTQNNLANAYRNRIRGERADNLERAIHHCKQALEVYTRVDLPGDWAMAQNNLANAYQDRIHGERTDNIEQAIHHFEQALEVYTRADFPVNYRRTQRSLGNLYFGQQDWALAETAYSEAIEAGSDLLAAAYTEIGRRDEVGETAQLYVDSAYCLIRLDRPGEGLLRLEQGKTRLLREALALDEAELALLPEADQQTMRAARQAVRELEAEMRLPPDTPARRSDRELAERLRRARSDLNRRVETVRNSRPEFMPEGLDLAELLELIPAGGALVAPLFTDQGSAVFVVPHGTATVTQDQVIELEGFTTADLHALLQGSDEQQVGGWLGAYANYYDFIKNPPPLKKQWLQAFKQWLQAIETTGQALWDRLLGPVHERLIQQGLQPGAPVLFMPQGGLGLLPVHAAWRIVEGRRRYFLDDWTLHHVPSGNALSIGRRRLQEPDRQGRGLLAIIDPTQDLRFTPAEGKAITALFPEPRSLEGDAAKVEAVMKAAPGRQYLHFSCHGFYHWQDPMQSGLVLAGKQRLTLSEIIAKLDLGACRLVVLSACETGLTDIRQSPDEYLGLPAGFLQAGAPAVISTLWPVSDLSTSLLMERFYRNLLGDNGKEPLPAASALRAAQCWLRDVSVAELCERGGDVAAVLEKSQASDTPFSHPYHWAGFTFSGA